MCISSLCAPAVQKLLFHCLVGIYVLLILGKEDIFECTL